MHDSTQASPQNPPCLLDGRLFQFQPYLVNDRGGCQSEELDSNRPKGKFFKEAMKQCIYSDRLKTSRPSGFLWDFLHQQWVGLELGWKTFKKIWGPEFGCCFLGGRLTGSLGNERKRYGSMFLYVFCVGLLHLYKFDDLRKRIMTGIFASIP